MKKALLLISSVLFLTSLQAVAQDKLVTINGEEFDVKVFEVNNDIVRIERLRTQYTDIRYFASKYVKSITFSDGFCVEFNSDGIPRRDNFLEAPVMKCRTNGIYAQGLFRLTDDETMKLLGPEEYYSMYMPSKSLLYTGIGQVLGGGALLAASHFRDEKHVVIQGRKGGVLFTGLELKGLSRPMNSYNIQNFQGKLNPYYVTAEIFGATTLVCGAVNFLSARSSLKSALDSNGPHYSIEKAKRRYWAGIGMAAAGVGAIVGGTVDIANKSTWSWSIWDESYERYNIKEGTNPIVGPILVLAGSVLVNVGLHEFILSGSRMKYFKKASTSITPNGLGLTLAF